MDAMRTATLGLMAAGARLFGSASNVAIAQSIEGEQGREPFLPLQAVQAAARQAGVGLSSRRGHASPVIKWPVEPWEMGGVAWSAGDLAREMVNLQLAKHAFQANLELLDAANDMQKSLVDLKA